MKTTWKNRLTPYDAELFMMVESLTGKPCVPEYHSRDCYKIVVDYSNRSDADFVNAIVDAVIGRIGERFVNIQDNPDAKQFVVKIKLSEHDYPFVIGDERDRFECDPEKGRLVYNRSGEKLRVIFLTNNVREYSRLRKFVGGGQIRIPRNEKEAISFHFLNGSVFLDAMETDAICRDESGHYFVMNQREFETWEQL